MLKQIASNDTHLTSQILLLWVRNECDLQCPYSIVWEKCSADQWGQLLDNGIESLVTLMISIPTNSICKLHKKEKPLNSSDDEEGSGLSIEFPLYDSNTLKPISGNILTEQEWASQSQCDLRLPFCNWSTKNVYNYSEKNLE